MGAHKLLLPLGNRPLLAHAVAAATSSGASPRIVVLGRDAERVSTTLPQQGITVAVNPDFATGMASSLRHGINALPAQAAGTLLLLGDQPLVTPTLIEYILAEARRHPRAIVAASFAGQRGHPVYFPRHYFAELCALQADEGGRNVIANHAHDLRLVEWPDVAAGFDVDTEDDYAQVLARWSAQADIPR